MPISCDSSEFDANGEGCLATKGSECTLLEGVVLLSLNEMWLPMRVSEIDPEEECDPAADVGLDCATPP